MNRVSKEKAELAARSIFEATVPKPDWNSWNDPAVKIIFVLRAVDAFEAAGFKYDYDEDGAI